MPLTRLGPEYAIAVATQGHHEFPRDLGVNVLRFVTSQRNAAVRIAEYLDGSAPGSGAPLALIASSEPLFSVICAPGKL